MIAIVVEYKWLNGELTATSGNPNDYFEVSDNGTGEQITKWTFPEPQPSAASLQAIEPTPAFQTYLTNRTIILARIRSKKSFNLQLELLALGLTAMDEINLLRDWLMDFKVEVAAAASLADLKLRIANNLPNLPQRTEQQAKNAYENKIDSL